MTSKNIIAGYCTTGVYPTDRHAVTLPGKLKMCKESSQKTRLSFFTTKKIAISSNQQQEHYETAKGHLEDPLSSSEEDSGTPLCANPAFGRLLHQPSAPLLKKTKVGAGEFEIAGRRQDKKSKEKRSRTKK